jgi:hypothetical protein
MIEFTTSRTGGPALVTVHGAVGGDQEAESFRESWDALMEELMDEGDVDVIVEIAGVEPHPDVASALAGWVIAFSNMDHYYRLAGAAPALRSLLEKEGVGPGSLFADDAAARRGPGDQPLTVKVEPFPAGELWVWADPDRKEDRALLEFLEKRKLSWNRIPRLRLSGESFHNSPDFVWKLFAGRLWPVEVAAGKALKSYQPRPESGVDESGEPYEDDGYNYNVWDTLRPTLEGRPFMVCDRKVLVGFNAAIGARLTGKR